MSDSGKVYVHVWTGSPEDARAIAERRYPGYEQVFPSHVEMRRSGWKEQVQILRRMQGAALIYYFDSIEDAQYVPLLEWSGLFHHCRETAVADSKGYFRVIRRRDWLRLVPQTIVGLLNDAWVFVSTFLLLWWMRVTARRIQFRASATGATQNLQIAYLYSNPLNRETVGGAMTHVRGVLGGLAACGVETEVFSGSPIAESPVPIDVVPAAQRPHFFKESLLLGYNARFARAVLAKIRRNVPDAIYQRHGRFVFSGALLSRWMRVPLILEYNGSEVWLDRYWDPGRFSKWIAKSEEVALAHASLIVVVSDALREELLKCGIDAERILVNPNGVDTEIFRPGVGDPNTRERLGIRDDEILVTFVGTFGPWHGVEILQEAIRRIVSRQNTDGERQSVRFLLVGMGALYPNVRAALEKEEQSGRVKFAGLVPHAVVRDYLDASDILVSPHVPMPDGQDFFGSPTKLFEYMATGKAIVASRLDQIAEVLKDRETALLVEPGNVDELCGGIMELSQNAELRKRLGQNAREAAVAHHSWKRNAEELISALREHEKSASDLSAAEISDGRIRPQEANIHRSQM